MSQASLSLVLPVALALVYCSYWQGTNAVPISTWCKRFHFANTGSTTTVSDIDCEFCKWVSIILEPILDNKDIEEAIVKVAGPICTWCKTEDKHICDSLVMEFKVHNLWLWSVMV
jgi:hypothetical protein